MIRGLDVVIDLYCSSLDLLDIGPSMKSDVNYPRIPIIAIVHYFVLLWLWSKLRIKTGY